MQKAFVESFNSRLRDECLNEHVFLSLAEARTTIEAWRDDYNCRRPHSSLGALTPIEFAQLKTEKLIPPPAGENNQMLSETRKVGSINYWSGDEVLDVLEWLAERIKQGIESVEPTK